MGGWRNQDKIAAWERWFRKERGVERRSEAELGRHSRGVRILISRDKSLIVRGLQGLRRSAVETSAGRDSPSAVDP